MKNNSVPLYRPGPINDVQDVIDEMNRINEMVGIMTDNNIRAASDQYEKEQEAKHEQEAKSKTAAKN